MWGSDEESFPELTASGHLNPPFTSTIRLQNPIFPNAAFSSLHRPRGGQSPPPGIFRPSAFDRSSDSIHDDGETATVPCSRLEVLELRCNGPGCGVLICSRALQPRTRHLRPQSSSSRVERRVFSTDVPPPTSAVAAIPPDATEASSTCRCKRAKLGCKTCGHALGYQILGCCRPCMSTVVSPTGKLHAFYFHHSSVRASRRPSLSSTRPLTWDALPSLQQELDQGLVGDPADWHASEYLPFWWPSPSPPDGLSADAKTSYQADRCWYHMFREQFHNKAALDAEEAFNGDSHASRSHQQGAPSIHHRDRNATCLPPASFGMLANSSELSGGTGTGGAAKRRRTYLAGR